MVLSGIYQVFISLILFWNTSVSVNCGLIELVGLWGGRGGGAHRGERIIRESAVGVGVGKEENARLWFGL